MAIMVEISTLNKVTVLFYLEVDKSTYPVLSYYSLEDILQIGTKATCILSRT
jgi:hypothetical protein